MFISSCLDSNIIAKSSSPDKSLKLELFYENNGVYYSLYKNNKPIIDKSKLGLMTDKFNFADNMQVLNVSKSAMDQEWTQVWGEQKIVRDHHNEVLIEVVESNSNLFLGFLNNKWNNNSELLLLLLKKQKHNKIIKIILLQSTVQYSNNNNKK